MNSLQGAVRAGALAAALIAAPGVVPAQDAGRLIMRARQRIEALGTDSARSLLRRALSPASDAGSAARVRGLVLLRIVELTAARPAQARLAFREALRLDPRVRVDSLRHLHRDLPRVVEGARAAVVAALRRRSALLEIRGLPAGARLTVDGVL